MAVTTLVEAFELQRVARKASADADKRVARMLAEVKNDLNPKYYKVLIGLYVDNIAVGKLAFSMHTTKDQIRNLRDSAMRQVRKLKK